MVNKLINYQLTEGEKSMLTGFSLPLAAKRANDYSIFFKPFDSKLSEIKGEISRLTGFTHVSLMNGENEKAAELLGKLANKEKDFKIKLLE